MAKAITSQFLREQSLRVAPFSSVFVADRDYNKPTTHWVTEKFYPWFEKEMGRINPALWRSRFDCDNFADFFFSWAQLAHANTKGSLAQGLAVGVVWYKRDLSFSGHAINCFYPGSELIFIEPQSGEMLKLSDYEKNSIWLIKF